MFKKLKGLIESNRNPRIYVILFAVALIIIATLSFFVNSYARAKDAYYDTHVFVTNKSKFSIQSHMNQVSHLSQSMMTNIYSLVNSSGDIDHELKVYREIYSTLKLYEELDNIDKMKLYVPSYKMYSRGNDSIESLSNFTSSDVGKNIKRNGEYWVISYENTQPVISCVLAYSSISEFNKLFSVLKVQLNLDYLDVLLENYPEGYNCILADASGSIIYNSSDKSGSIEIPDLTSIASENIGSDPFAVKINIDGKRSVAYCSKLDNLDIYVLSASNSNLSRLGLNDISISIIIMLALLSFGVLLIMINTYNLAIDSSIQKLVSIANAIEKNDAPSSEIISEKKNFIKLKHLSSNVDHTAMQVMLLIDKQYRSEILARSSQMKALQAQINPHFLYNTLDVIKWMIASGDTEGSVWMINSLSKYFRLSLKNGRDIVCVNEEVELTKAYLSIMKKRFSDAFEIEYHIDEETENCSIPKMTLQPIVENALLHGVLENDKKGCVISITSYLEGDMLIFEVSDTGIGMDEETKDKLLKGEQVSKSSSGYGLKNVYERLSLFGGENAAINIESTEGIGTTVVIKVKAYNSQAESFD